MTFWAVVPVKPFRIGKSRLAGKLSPTERAELNQRFLLHTIDTLKSVPEIEQVLVVSLDPSALALAREHGARTIQENGSSHLNLALERATRFAREYITGAVLIVPADLPLLTQADVRSLLEHAKNPPFVAIAPDRRREGTNALLVSPPGLIEYGFGPGSFKLHCERAARAGARLELVESPTLALDVDLPEDLEVFEKEALIPHD